MKTKLKVRRSRPFSQGLALPVLAVALILGAWAGAQDQPAAAADASAETAALAKAAQNPVSSMVSLPFQYNLNIGADRYDLDKNEFFSKTLLRHWISEQVGGDGILRLRLRNHLFGDHIPGLETHDRTQHILNIQPVYPVTVGSLNLINRLIMPVLYQPVGRDDGEFGLGDFQYTLFLAPAKSGKIIWGAGPALSLPTATDDMLGTGKWSAGPAAVVLTMPGHWVLGALVQNLWSFAGEGDRPEVNSLLIQPFVNYNLKQGWYLSYSPVITANWKADSGDRWTVPVGAGVGKIFKIGKQPLNASVGAYYNVVKPEGGADWNLRFQVQFMFPKKPQ